MIDPTSIKKLSSMTYRELLEWHRSGMLSADNQMETVTFERIMAHADYAANLLHLFETGRTLEEDS